MMVLKCPPSLDKRHVIRGDPLEQSLVASSALRRSVFADNPGERERERDWNFTGGEFEGHTDHRRERERERVS